MSVHMRNYFEDDIDDIVELSLLAWEPVFISLENELGPNIFPILYPDWQESQRNVVMKICQDDQKYQVLVAEMDDQVVGFLVFELKQDNESGDVQLLAVHPAYQNQGIGTALNLLALQQMKAAGMKMAVVETGGDEGHAPARRSYEKAGYTPLPLVRYFQDL